MSKRRGIWASLPLAALDWCKKTAGRYWRFAGGRVWSITDGRRADEFEASLPKNPVHVDFCGERIELREFIKVLSIGDRIRLLCDDGLLVAEKISETQCKIIHSEMVGKLIQ
jgi:hypothetical protein